VLQLMHQSEPLRLRMPCSPSAAQVSQACLACSWSQCA
jgi:hypothetical protein